MTAADVIKGATAAVSLASSGVKLASALGLTGEQAGDGTGAGGDWATYDPSKKAAAAPMSPGMKAAVICGLLILVAVTAGAHQKN